MASTIDICNLALANLGDDATVTALVPPDGSAQADFCVRFYPIARDAVIEAHAWSFATRRQSLAVIDTDELPGTWQYAYALPNPFLSPISILQPQTPSLTSFPISDQSVTGSDLTLTDQGTQDFIIETLSDGTLALFTNVEDAILRYIISVEDTSKFTPLFVVALSRLLASMLSGPLLKGTVGMKVEQGQREFYEKIDLPRAKFADSRGRKFSSYNNFTPDGLKARA